jgi:ribosomal protein L37AE/L43A
MDIPNKIYRCEKCRDTGIVKELNGDVHTCWKCLQEGKLGQHSDKLPGHNVKI